MGAGGAERALQSHSGEKIVPRRLKPNLICGGYGTAKAVPFQSASFFCVRALLAGAVETFRVRNAGPECERLKDIYCREWQFIYSS